MGQAARRVNLWIRHVLIRRAVNLASPLLFPLAALWRRLLLRTTFIAVTGSVGKTAAKELLARVHTKGFASFDEYATEKAVLLEHITPGGLAILNGAVIVRDDYSASIDTFEASLQFLREARAVRRVLVLSDVSDSGENHKSRLRRLSAVVAGRLDVLVLTGREQGYGCRKAGGLRV